MALLNRAQIITDIGKLPAKNLIQSEIDAKASLVGSSSLIGALDDLESRLVAVDATSGLLNATAGVATASKAVILDANKDIATLRHLTISGNLVTGSTTLSETELGYLDGLTTGTVTASKALVVDTNKDLASLRHLTLAGNLVTSANVGTAETGTTAVERGTSHRHQTILTVSTTLPAIAGGADLGIGKLLYTFPAGVIIINYAYMTLAITQSQGNITADTPDVGLGTVIASGVVNVLSGTATFENIITGQTAADCNGTATVKTANPTAGVPFIIEAGAARTVYFNAADGWTAGGDAAAALAGTVVLDWTFIA